MQLPENIMRDLRSVFALGTCDFSNVIWGALPRQPTFSMKSFS